MNRFKIGDQVEIVRHTKDSSDNYNIGDFDFVVDIASDDGDHQPYCLRGRGSRYGAWWVDAECLDLATLNLENE